MSNSYDSDPAKLAYDANLSDTADLTNGICRALYIGVTGNVKVTMPDGTAVTFTGAPVGVLPVKARRVWSTGTTATNIVALY